MMTLGGLLGYAAAPGEFASLWQARAAAQASEAGPAGNPGPSCCPEGGGREVLLSRAGGPEARQEEGGPGRNGQEKDATTRSIKLKTNEVTDPDVAVSSGGKWLVFNSLGHLFRLSTEGGATQ